MARTTNRRSRSSLAGSPDPIFALIEAHREAWALIADIFTEDTAEDPVLRGKLERVAEAAHDRLLKAPPTTLAGARAVIKYLIEFDEPNIPFESYGYLQTLLESPIFASKGPSEPMRDADVDTSKADNSDPVFGVIEAHKKGAALFETTPTTLAGARAILEYFAELDQDELSADETIAYRTSPPTRPRIFEETVGYLKTLIRSPIFASKEGA
jgi:hypothetical protein